MISTEKSLGQYQEWSEEYGGSLQDGTVFCLCEAPNKEAAETVHREAHGLISDEIIEVKKGH